MSKAKKTSQAAPVADTTAHIENLRNLYALENSRGALSIDEAMTYQAAIDSPDADSLAEVLAMYEGDAAKLSLSQHDKKQLALAVEALS